MKEGLNTSTTHTICTYIWTRIYRQIKNDVEAHDFLLSYQQ